MVEQLMGMALFGLLATAIMTDLGSSRIPNWLTMPAMVCGLAGHAWPHGLQGLFFSLIGLLVGLGLFLFLHLLGSVGAGDVKLMAAVGAMVGPEDVLMAAMLAIAVGGLYALAAMIYHWGWDSTVKKLGRAAQHSALTGGQEAWRQELALPFRLRYGLAIAGGTLLLQLGFRPFGG